MSNPHDYYGYDGDPQLHNHCESADYVDPDYWANSAQRQVPLLSTIGRGPKGDGLFVGNVVDEPGNVSFGLYSTETGELEWQSPNLAPPTFEFVGEDWRDLTPGQPARLVIRVSQGGISKEYEAYIPGGSPGSTIYLLKEPRDYSADGTFQTTVGDLVLFGRENWPSKPTPRPGDVVMFPCAATADRGLAFGYVEYVGGPATKDAVVFTIRGYIPFAIPVATKDLIGGVKSGDEVSVDQDGNMAINWSKLDEAKAELDQKMQDLQRQLDEEKAKRKEEDDKLRNEKQDNLDFATDEDIREMKEGTGNDNRQ